MTARTLKGLWYLVEAGQFEQAIEAYTKLYDQTGLPLYVHNRGLSHLNLGDYSSALADFELELAITDPALLSDSEYTYAGICHLYLNRPTRALSIWRRSLDTPYTGSPRSTFTFVASLRGGEAPCRRTSPRDGVPLQQAQ